jgi:hypothetical protein
VTHGSLAHAAGFLDKHILQGPPVVELTSDPHNPQRVVRRLAFDRTLPPLEALGRIRDAFQRLRRGGSVHGGLKCCNPGSGLSCATTDTGMCAHLWVAWPPGRLDSSGEEAAVMAVTRDERIKNRLTGDLRRRSASLHMVAVAVTVLVGLVAVAGCSPGDDTSSQPTSGETGGGSLQAMTGELVLEPMQTTEIETDSGQIESRDSQVSGTISLEADDPHTGTVQITGSASHLGTVPPPTVHHVWGTVDAVIDDVPCTGAFGWTYFDDPPETGGSLHLRCEDNTVLAARTTVASIEAVPGTWRFTVDREDGFYISQ